MRTMVLELLLMSLAAPAATVPPLAECLPNDNSPE